LERGPTRGRPRAETRIGQRYVALLRNSARSRGPRLRRPARLRLGSGPTRRSKPTWRQRRRRRKKGSPRRANRVSQKRAEGRRRFGTAARAAFPMLRARAGLRRWRRLNKAKADFFTWAELKPELHENLCAVFGGIRRFRKTVRSRTSYSTRSGRFSPDRSRRRRSGSTANFKETQLRQDAMRANPRTIRVGRPFNSRVRGEWWSSLPGAAGNHLQPVATRKMRAGNFVKVVQRLPVSDPFSKRMPTLIIRPAPPACPSEARVRVELRRKGLCVLHDVRFFRGPWGLAGL